MRFFLQLSALILALGVMAAPIGAGDVVDIGVSQNNVNAGGWKNKDEVNINGITGPNVVVTVTDGMYDQSEIDSPTPPTDLPQDLHITTQDGKRATLVFGKTSSSDSSIPATKKYLVFNGDATLAGSYNNLLAEPVGWATIEVGEGAIFVVGGESILGDYSRIIVEGDSLGDGARFATNELSINGKESYVEIGAGGSLQVGSTDSEGNRYGVTSVQEGSIKITDGGSAEFHGAVDITGDKVTDGKASLVLSGDSTVTAHSGIHLRDGGLLHVDTSSAGTAIINGRINNETGRIVIDAGAVLEAKSSVEISAGSLSGQGMEVDGILKAESLRIFSQQITDQGLQYTTSGKVTIGATGEIHSDNVAMQGGALDIQGMLTGSSPGLIESTLAISGGSVRVSGDGIVEMDNINATGGAFAAGAGSVLKVGSFAFSGSAVATISGTVEAGARISAGGNSKLTIDSGTDKIETLEALTVSGNATVNIGSTFTTDALSGSGGALNMNSGTMTVNNNASLGSSVHLNGGTFNFLGNAAVSGGLYAEIASTTINMNANSLNIGTSGVLDTQNGSILLQDAGDVNINGTYIVGYDSGAVTMLTISNGGSSTLTVGESATIQLNLDARRVYMQDTPSGELQILATNGSTQAGSLIWNSGSVIFTYEVKSDGLYVTGARTLGRDEQKDFMLNQWRKDPRVGNNVNNLFHQTFIDAVIDGAALAEGTVAGFNTLSSSGKFNASVLSSLINPSFSGAGYDALMLYNGSGLAMANEAILSSNIRLMRRIGDRNDIVRREVIREQQQQRGVYGDIELCDLEPESVRLWADGLYYSDSASTSDGFAGYKYRGRGLVIGGDRRVGEVWGGASLALVDGSFRDQAALSNDSDITTYAAIIYLGYQHDSGVYLNTSLGYAYSDNDLKDQRILNGINGYNRASFASRSVMASLTVGRDFEVGDFFTVTPAAGLRYINTRHNSHQQSFGGSGAQGAETIRAGKITAHSSSVPLDLAFSYDAVMDDEERAVSITGKVGYEYEMSNQGAKGNITYAGLGGIGPVRIVSREPGRHVLNLGISTRYLYKNYEFGFAYDYSGRKNFNSHALTFSAGMTF